MSSNHFNTLSDSDLEAVNGGLRIVGDTEEGLSIESALGSISIPSPLPVLEEGIGILGETLEGVFGALTSGVKKLGGLLFNFS